MVMDVDEAVKDWVGSPRMFMSSLRRHLRIQGVPLRSFLQLSGTTLPFLRVF
jgi:hypothetical protein